MRVVVVDSGGANLGSVCYAFERLGVKVELAADAGALRQADRVVLPGVGAAANAMRTLQANGLIEPLRALRRPLLGICLGMQLLYEGSEEGDVECLGLLPGRVRRLPPAPGIRVPHMGWNRLQQRATSPLLNGVRDGAQAYFVHSYAAPVSSDCIAACSHGEPFAAMVQRGLVAGAQFHPERSAATGARILENFLRGLDS